ncbi:helix-turn-helix transcriptional regulator [Demequina sp. NBRC 110053]|uniref:ArsR/SmtB family transcription factor n=1 Tax=Demequina sp. NBRC 110053 TaxID=1570342 RepID=UPI000A029293|nr:metalloregulator ArsR/SmtB family transcription factor [Demequina sp. NBRC 110053]
MAPRHVDDGLTSLAELDRVIHALANPTRRYLLELLRHDGAEAMDLNASTRCAWSISQARASQHLSVLRGAGLVTVTPFGATRHYRFQPGSADVVAMWISTLGKP